MRFLLALLLIALFAAIAEYFLPWWSLAIPAFIIGFAVRLRTGVAFLAGFTGIFILWLGAGLWRDIPNHHILSDRMADLILHHKTGIAYLLLSAFAGGLVGGLAAWSGAQVKRLNHDSRD